MDCSVLPPLRAQTAALCPTRWSIAVHPLSCLSVALKSTGGNPVDNLICPDKAPSTRPMGLRDWWTGRTPGICRVSIPCGGVDIYTRARRRNNAMAFIPAPNTARVSLVMNQDGQTIVNVFHFTKVPTSPFTFGELQQLAQDFVTTWVNTVAAHQNADVAYTSIVARALDSLSAPSYEGPITGNGDVSDTPMPTNVTIAIKWITALGGRSYRGRTYHVGLSAGSISNSTLAQATLDAILAAYNEFLTQMGALGWRMVVTSYQQNGIPRVSGISTAITGAVAEDNALDSQRRRLPKRGT